MIRNKSLNFLYLDIFNSVNKVIWKVYKIKIRKLKLIFMLDSILIRILSKGSL